MNEVEAEDLLAAQLVAGGARIARQVRLGLKRADVMVEWPNEQGSPGDLEAIEVKLSDWRRAVHQAYLSMFYAHRASIAMPRERIAPVDRDYLLRLGVGMIAFDEAGWTRVVEPRRRSLPAAMSAAVRGRLGE